MAKERKSSTEIYNSRVDMVYSMLCQAYSTKQIKDYAKKKTDWKVDDRQVENYIRKARILIKEAAGEDGKKVTAEKCKLNMWRLYRKAMSSNDYNLAHRILKDINTMFGEENATEINVTAKVGALRIGFGD